MLKNASKIAWCTLGLWLVNATLAAAQEQAPSHPGADAPKRPNVLFYLMDTTRADRLSVYGNETSTTPFLKKLAADGVVFESCHSQAPWTKPSMASILTSMYPSVVNIVGVFDRLDESFVTLPEVLRDAGYYTAGFSVNPIMGRMSGYNQGFRYFKEAFAIIPGGDAIRFASGSAAAINKNVIPWLTENEHSPYFLYLHSLDPHEEYEPELEHIRHLAGERGKNAAFDEAWKEKDAEYRAHRKSLLESIGAPEGFPVLHLTPSNFEKTGVVVAPFIEHTHRLYEADLLANDRAIEQLFEHLESIGQLDDLIVVITADHGEELWEHEGTSHGFALYEELVHVPFILWSKKHLPSGKRIAQPVQSIDIYPTLLELLGLEAPADIQGRSLMPLVRGEALEPRPVYMEKQDDPLGESIGVRMGSSLAMIHNGWKLVWNLDSPMGRELPRLELYHLEKDAGETNNLAEERSDIAKRFEGYLREWAGTSAERRSGGRVTEEALDERTIERLKKLGYIK